jgi:hypothetical protein
MEKVAVKLVVSNGEDFGYWKNRTMNYLLSQGRAIWEIVQTRYIILEMLQNAIQGELQRYENNYKTLNLITTALGRNVYDCVVLCLDSLVSAHDLIMVFIPHIGRVFFARGVYSHLEPSRFDSPRFSRHGSCPTCSNGEVQKTVKTSLGHMV